MISITATFFTITRLIMIMEKVSYPSFNDQQCPDSPYSQTMKARVE